MSVPLAAFAEAVVDQGVTQWSGVPCSSLGGLVSFAATDERCGYTAASSEGEAIGIAAGAALCGELPLVLIQNSGLGNCVNPLTSLSCTYGLPLLLLLSHRGRDGDDAPQHLLMGARTEALLDTLGIARLTLGGDLATSCATLAAAATRAREGACPLALIAPPGLFVSDSEATMALAERRIPGSATGFHAVSLASRSEALEALDQTLSPDDLLVATTGMTSRELYALHDRQQTFYMMGSMGCAAAIGLGVARCRPRRKIVVVDGDGALLMKLGTLATVGQQQPGGLLHLVLDNGCYETTGGQPTASASLSFEDLAMAAGYRRALALASPDELSRLVADFRPGDGPLFATLRIAAGHRPGVGRVGRTPQAIRDAFRAALLDELLVP